MGLFKLKKSILSKSKVYIDSCYVDIKNTFLNNVELKIYNSNIYINNSLFINNKKSIDIINSNNSIINNCLFYHTYGFSFLKTDKITPEAIYKLIKNNKTTWYSWFIIP